MPRVGFKIVERAENGFSNTPADIAGTPRSRDDGDDDNDDDDEVDDIGDDDDDDDDDNGDGGEDKETLKHTTCTAYSLMTAGAIITGTTQ